MTELDAVRQLYPDPDEPSSSRLWTRVESGIAGNGSRSSRSGWFATSRPRWFGVVLAVVVMSVLLGSLRRQGAGWHLEPASASAQSILRHAAARVRVLPDLKTGQILHSNGTYTVVHQTATRSGRPYFAFYRFSNDVRSGLDGSFTIGWTPGVLAGLLGGRPVAGERPPLQLKQPPSSLRTFSEFFGLSFESMRALPTDRRSLESDLMALSRTPTIGGDPFAAATRILIGPARPAVKAAVFSALAHLPGVERFANRRVDGRLVYVVARDRLVETPVSFQPSPTFALLDPTTGEIVAESPSGSSRNGLITRWQDVLLIDAHTAEIAGVYTINLDRFASLPAGTRVSDWRWKEQIEG